ncbi:chemotaxis protein CheA [Thermodesulforhabdus norvegica]|uniref:Chemotaxis protein CheA n=1 Tax=Thermodesulforhabdus norvegica TaxID=39841 RepID=A0A1I4RE02_9BACT|nr:chemotaxis protein CheA [Thermodesulforhabdus norvegica]SFM50501.1 two-component system, chemotaxis family, sensor kinase CheA [Thermodesulforhabdus norvegica]
MEKKQEILEKLSRGVIASPDDLIGMGECLNLLDELENLELTSSEREIISELRGVLKRLILEDSSNVEKDWQEIKTLINKLSGETPPEKITTGKVEETPSEALSETHTSEQAQEEALSVVTTPVDDPELLKDFLEEAREHLNEIEINMITLEENPEDREVVNAIFRPFHSIKGVAGFLNLKDIHELSHEVENLLDGARSGNYPVTEAIIDIVLQSVDILKEQLALIEEGLKAGEIQISGDPKLHRLLKYIRNFDPTKEAPPVTVPPVGKILAERGAVEEEEVEEAAEEAKKEGKKLGEKLIEKGLVTPKDVAGALREQRKLKDTSSSIRVDTAKLDNLVDMIGELVIAQSMVLQNPEVQKIKSQKFQKDIVQLRRITGELQRISTSLRMIPIKSTFQKMIRLVRDLSRKSGKEVVLKMYGEETEIDRNMVDQIYEPLVHMIRNAIDHGIEPPDERVKTGKPAHGTIILSAEQKSGNIVIDIKDDGRGLDAAKIRKKAIERGLISPDDQLDEEEIFQLIFQPGFSTKETVTDVSGRGVGMDVVKKCVESLRGKIEVNSTPGKGSHFQLKLPLTMAIIDGMIIQVGNERYVVPTISLKESLRPDQKDYCTVQGRGEMINVRGTLMPLIRLYELFDVEPKFRNPWEALLLVVNEDGRNYCLLADEILGRQEVVIKSLGSIAKNVAGISGGAIMGDGKVALILDVKGIVSVYEGKQK